jgi:dipeptide/tripeptide permease
MRSHLGAVSDRLWRHGQAHDDLETERVLKTEAEKKLRRIALRVAVILGVTYFLVSTSIFHTGALAQAGGADAKAPTPSATETAADDASKAPVAKAPDGTCGTAAYTAIITTLSANISDTPEAKDAELPSDSFACVSAAKKTNLKETLSNKEKAGKFIHELRMKGLVPAAQVKWLGNDLITPEAKADEKGGDASKEPQLRYALGVVTLKDGRHRAIKVEVDDAGLVAAMTRPTALELGAKDAAQKVLTRILAGDAAGVWAEGAEVPTFFDASQKRRSVEEFKADLDSDHITKIKTDESGAPKIKWGTKDTELEGGFRLNGTAEAEYDGKTFEIPLMVVFLDGPDGLMLLDVQNIDGFLNRVQNGSGDSLDMTLFILACAILLGFLYMLFQYYRGLQDSPREIWLLFFTKVTEYSAYGAAQLAFMFYLRQDMGLSDLGAGTYYSAWSTILTLLTMLVGAVCDAVGVKRTLLVGAICLMFSRAVMPFADDIIITTIFGFLPLAVGIAITGPVLSVGVKKYTTMEGAAMGFAAFYTLMNVGWALGAAIFDAVRVSMGNLGSVDFLGANLSTYEVILGIGFFINLPDFVAILIMRRGVEMTESGVRIEKFEDENTGESWVTTMVGTFKKALKDTVRIFGENFVEKAFWVFLLLIGMTVFARLTFFHFHLTWPSYGARYLGQGSLVGNIFGVWNPVLIVFLAPLMGLVTRKISSYWMLLIGTLISVGSIFFVVVDPSIFAGLCDNALGAIVFDRWLEVPEGFRDPFYMSMFLFVTVFTVGEAIWSPRLMQFTAEIAPPGREGSYVALAYLPYFLAKFIAGPMAGWLLMTYTPEFGIDGQYMNYPDHQTIWWWIGGTAALTPVGLLVFRKLYKAAEDRAKEAALEAAEDAAAPAS